MPAARGPIGCLIRPSAIGPGDATGIEATANCRPRTYSKWARSTSASPRTKFASPMNYLRPFARDVASSYVGLLVLGVCLVSCGSDDPEIRRYPDTGSLCLLPHEQGGTKIAITFDPCLSCDDLPVASCSATVTGSQIAVSTALDVGKRPNPPQVCPAACIFASATCDLIVPDAGEYRLVLYGGKSATVVLPATSPIAPYDDHECGG
jgi:hypothetical protein